MRFQPTWQRQLPVETDHVASARDRFLDVGARAEAEVDHGHPYPGDRLEQAPVVRLHVARVVGRAERADPAIEELERCGPARPAPARSPTGDRRAAPSGRAKPPARDINAFVRAKSRDAPALDQIARQREGRAAKPINGAPVAPSSRVTQADRLATYGRSASAPAACAGRSARERIGVCDHRPDALDELEIEAHARRAAT